MVCCSPRTVAMWSSSPSATMEADLIHGHENHFVALHVPGCGPGTDASPQPRISQPLPRRSSACFGNKVQHAQSGRARGFEQFRPGGPFSTGLSR